MLPQVVAGGRSESRGPDPGVRAGPGPGKLVVDVARRLALRAERQAQPLERPAVVRMLLQVGPVDDFGVGGAPQVDEGAAQPVPGTEGERLRLVPGERVLQG